MRPLLKLALMASSALFAAPVLAQNQPTPPEHYTLDGNNVDAISGKFFHAVTDMKLGQETNGGLAIGRIWTGTGWRDSVGGSIHASGTTYTLNLPNGAIIFTRSGSTFTPARYDGSTLTLSGTSKLIYRDRQGEEYLFSIVSTPGSTQAESNYNQPIYATLDKQIRPNGETIEYIWGGSNYCANTVEDICEDERSVYRLGSVSNNFGYVIDFNYKTDTIEWWEASPSDFISRVGATGYNRADKACPLSSCPGETTTVDYGLGWIPGQSLKSVHNSGGVGETYTYGAWVDGGQPLSGIRAYGASADHVSLSYNTAGRVSAVTGAAGTWNYAYADAGDVRTTTTTGPLGQSLTIVSNLTVGRATSVKDALGRTTAYQYDGQRRLQRVTRPEGDYTHLTYDARGNVTLTRQVAKPGSGLADITTSAVYPTSCGNPAVCNLPTSTTDALGRTTDYTYDAVHGGVLTVTAPAPTSGAARPQTRIAYAAQTATFKHYLGGVVPASASVTLPVSASTCITGTTCAGTANEVKTTILYGAAGAPNNLQPTSMTVGSGDGSLSATTTLTYTPQGDLATVNGPLAGTADTTTYRYDTARRLVGVISPDPDGTGPLLRRAERYAYNPRGQVTLAETGTVTGLTDTNWSAFASLQKTALAYDAFGRLTHQRQQSGSTTHALTQVSYDAAGRTDCTTTRMNPTAFTSPPAAACTVSAIGSFGTDRIMKNAYDEAGRLISTTSGTGSLAITESATYSANGQPLTLTDGKGNVSTIEYDGFDRAVKMRYPNAAGGGSTTTDYEQYTYDAVGNVTQYRNRAGELIGVHYDALNRAVTQGGSAIADRTFSYDNMGRLTGAAMSGGGSSLSRTWDALGRLTSETQNPLGKTVAYQYDLAGRRTRLTWPDGFFVNYDYNVGGDLTAIRENGATGWELTSWAYDNLGRRTAQARANGASTAWGYDAAGRLASLSHDLPGTANDLGLTFTYNPAGQIVSRTMSNTAYAYSPSMGATNYVNNGRNQVTSVGGSAVTYDARQNIAAAPMGSYAYDGLNQMTSATVSGATTTFGYDPAGRMFQMGATRLLHDGARPMAEYDAAGNVLRRYVPGLAMDETVAAYEGAGLTDRRWLLADERLSVAAYTNGTGGVLSRNTYDEYGQPGSGNAGLFQYTGQIWLPQAQLYHYKARAYAPQLGRFIQADPIGYRAGVNLYAYVGGDPVNWVDALGMQRVAWLCLLGSYMDRDGVVVGVQGECSVDFPDPGPGPRPGGGGGGGTGRPAPAPPQVTEQPEINCRLWSIGQGFGDLGAAVETVGLLEAAGGAVVGLGGAVTGNVPAAGLGVLATAQGLGIAAWGGGLAMAGEISQFIAGDPLPSFGTLAVELSPLRLLPNDLLNQGASFIGGNMLADAIEDRRATPCR